MRFAVRFERFGDHPFLEVIEATALGVGLLFDSLTEAARCRELIDAYRAGIPGNGKPFPDGSRMAKIHWTPKKLATFPLATVPGAQQNVDFMVKDSKNSHPGNSLWGDGWGWSWFDADKPLKTTSTNYKTDCQGCHVPAQSTDWIYVNGYPALWR